ncbi:MAG: hypothetical protein ACTSVM_01635 [Candidatus Ranarchaeia archaeon]
MKLLNLITNLLAYDPINGETNNPQQRIADWKRQFLNLPISNPKSDNVSIEPSETRSIFSGIRTTSLDGTTAFDVSLLANQTSTYRFAHSAGTAPGFRTARALSTDATSEITVTVNNNATAELEATGGTIASFAAVTVGDVLRISGATTGDVDGPFNDLNEGYWTVLSATATKLTCKRPLAEGFSGSAESSILLGADFATNFIVYSANGVQVGDSVEISAGFSSVTQKTFVVSQVTPLFFEVVSVEPLPLETAIVPGVAGMVFYTEAKRVIYLETDRNAEVRLNGASGSEVRMSPFISGDETKVAVYLQVGLVYSLEVVNRSDTAPMNVYFFFAG